MAVFIVNGRKRYLKYMVNGIDISNDFIGNTAHNMAIEEDGSYVASKEDFNWWKKVIEEHERLDMIVAQYQEEFGKDEVNDTVYSWASYDYETNPAQILMGLEKRFGKLE